MKVGALHLSADPTERRYSMTPAGVSNPSTLAKCRYSSGPQVMSAGQGAAEFGDDLQRRDAYPFAGRVAPADRCW
jgi:hypothetical protein